MRGDLPADAARPLQPSIMKTHLFTFAVILLFGIACFPTLALTTPIYDTDAVPKTDVLRFIPQGEAPCLLPVFRCSNKFTSDQCLHFGDPN